MTDAHSDRAKMVLDKYEKGGKKDKESAENKDSVGGVTVGSGKGNGGKVSDSTKNNVADQTDLAVASKSQWVHPKPL